MAARFPEGVEAESVCLVLANGSEHEALLRGGGEHIGVVQKSKENGKAANAFSHMNFDESVLLQSGGDFFPSASDYSDAGSRGGPGSEAGSKATLEQQAGCEAFLSDQSNWGSANSGPPSVPEIPRDKKPKEDFESQNLSYVNVLSVPGPNVGSGAIPDRSAFELSPSPVVVGVLTVQEEPQGSEIGTPVPFDKFTIHNNVMNLPLDHGVIQSSSPESRLGRPDSEGLAPGTPHENEPSSDLRRDSSSASKLPFNPPEASYSGLLRPAGTVKNWGILRNMMATSPRNQMEPMEGWEGSAVVQAANAGGNGVAGGVATTPGGGGATVVHATNEMDASVVVEPEDKENLVESRGFDVRTEGGSLVREPSDVVLAGRSPMKAPEAHQNPQGPFAEANRLQGYDSVTNAAAETVAVVVQRMLNRDESPYRQAKSSDCEIEDSQVPGMWINDVWTRKDVEDLDSDIRSALTEEGIDPGEYFKRDYTDFPSVAHYYINLHDRLNDRMDEELIDLVASFSGRLGPTHPLVEAMKEVMAAQQQGEPCTRFSSGLLVDISMNLDDSGVLLVQNEEWIDDRPPVINTDASAAPTIGSKLNTINTGGSSSPVVPPPPVEEMSRESVDSPPHEELAETGEDTEESLPASEDEALTAPEIGEVRKDIRGLSWVVKKPSLKKGKLVQAAGPSSELSPHRELQAQTSHTSLVSQSSSRPQPSTPAPEIEFMQHEVRDFSNKHLLRRETREGPRDVYMQPLPQASSKGWCCCF